MDNKHFSVSVRISAGYRDTLVFDAGGLKMRKYSDSLLFCDIILDNADERRRKMSLAGRLSKGENSVRFDMDGAAARLYINGVLEDEEWPIGGISLSAAADGLPASVTDVMPPVGQDMSDITDISRWTPYGLRAHVGDCMPFSHDGVWHLFWLFDRRGHGSKWGLGAHQWAHVSTTDFKTWKRHPMAVPITEQDEGSICTGSAIFAEGRYYCWYAIRSTDGSPARITASVSDDGVNFKKTGRFITLAPPYHSPSARDPKVVAGDDGLYHMFVTTSRYGKGALAHLTSPDMENWTQLEDPILQLDIENQPECPDWFEWNGKYYLVFSNFGMGRYVWSYEPFSGWRGEENGMTGLPLGDEHLRVPKTAFFGERLIAASFTCIEAGYGGEITFLELKQNGDGTISTFIPEEFA